MPDFKDFLPPPPWEGPPVPRGLLREVRRGLCYELAWRWLKDHRDGTLVHGEVFAGEPRRWIGHAWVEWTGELGIPLVYEPQSDDLLKKTTFYLKFRAKPAQKYTWEEAAKLALKTGHYGPWEEHERAVGD